MEFASKLRWVIVVFILLFVLIFAGWGLSTIARNIFNSSSDSAQVNEDDSQEISTLQSAKVVRYIVDGPTVANTEHRSYSIEVTSSVVSMKVYSEYGQKVIAEKTYKNNSLAYDTFIESLKKANATARYKGTDADDDTKEQGVCPVGMRYILEIGEDIRRWTTSCDRKDGTAAGMMTTIRGLFTKQVPDFEDLTRGLKLNAN